MNDAFHFPGIGHDIFTEATLWRHHIHQHPELAFKENKTSDLVCEQLTRFGVVVHRGIARTGVVGILSAGSSSKSIALRADMDALPIEENTGLPYASTVPGVFHGCGHDGHVAMLLGAARYLAATRKFNGTIYFIFQPAEEGHGGAREMVQEGLFRRFPVDRIFALHNWPHLPLGSIVARNGAMMAAADKFQIKISANGGHAALPTKTGDAILAAASLVTQLQTIVSRRVPANDAAVLSVTQIHGGHTHNVLPATVTLGGTVRSFDATVQDGIELSIKQMAEGIALGAGVTADVTYDRYYPATINNPDAAEFVRALAASSHSGLQILDVDPSMASEDFGYMLKAVPGCYFWLGSGQEGHEHALHTPRFDFNDNIIPLGIRFWVALAQSSLPANNLFEE